MQYQFSNRISSLQPSVIREILKFTADPNVIAFAGGNPSAQAFPVTKVADITADILKNDPITALQYSVTEGYTPLRDKLKDLMRTRYQVGTDDDDLIIVSGAQQGVDLTTKCLCNEGDTVICESPTFIGSLNSFRSYNVNLVGVEMEDDGIHVGKLEQALKENPNTKFLYLIPNFQNPSGITMSLEKRKAVYALAKQYGVMILEDNPYGDLRYSGEDIPSIKSMDTDGIVIYCGSFSKILSPGLRVGFVVANKQPLSKIIVAKQVADVHTSILSQLISYKFLTECDLDEHFDKLREIYRAKCQLMLSQMDAQFEGKVTYTRPEGGLFIWCTLPAGSDMMQFCKDAVLQNVAVVPGNAFTMREDDPTTSFRMNFSTPSDENIIKGVEILGKLIKERF
ncbi:PLP-dependent aminotransferase family protein [Candidatus Soleaferrea massiliensis]|uniref:aminotransferase-like domain-containing protein n=1 Tax=Candidatus Soleaferrea massiliensis TaxID=1470354 RepID=UPI00058B35F7|nr:PLP-dependent aminotransferase family protein [Candidatus Soleaferrea massiliensis]